MPNPRHAPNTLDAASEEFAAFERYAALTSRKRTLQYELEDVEAGLKALEPQLLAHLGQGSLEMVRVSGYTISPHREPWVYPKANRTRSDVCQALKACGLAHYVMEQFNTRSLTKYVRDLEEERGMLSEEAGAAELLLPAELAQVIEIKPTYRIQARR